MPDDLQRLETALRNADAAGDTAAAQQIAQAIRSRRAEVPQGSMSASSTASPVAPDVFDQPDPYEGAPTEIGGVPLTEDLREAILLGRNIKDPKQKRILTARIAGRLAADDRAGGNIADEIQRSGFGAALRGFGTGLFGLGDVAAAGVTALKGIGDENAMSFGEALEAQREFRHALEKDFPVTSGLSEVAGAVAAPLGSAKLIGAGGRQALRGLTQIKRGERARNLLKASALGAGTGALTEGISEGEAGRGAIEGGIGGVLGLGLVKAAGIGKEAVSNFLNETTAGKSLELLARKLAQTPEELAHRFLQFEAVTGKKPAIADLANEQSVAELRDLIAERTGAREIAEQAGEASVRRRGGEFRKQLTGETAATPGRVTTTEAAQQSARERVALKQFGDVAEQDFVFSPDEVKNLLNDPDLRRGLPPTLKRRIDEALNKAGEDAPVTLKGLDVNDLRMALRDRAKGATGADRVYGELADDVEDIARSQSEEFGRAIDEFAMRSRRGEAVTTGRKGVRAKESVFTQEVKDLSRKAIEGQPAEGAAITPASELAGIRSGIRSELADVGGETAGSAKIIAENLAQDSGLVRRLRTVMKPAEVDRLQELARIQQRAFRNVENLSPAAKAEVDKGMAQFVNEAADLLVTASPTTSPASKVFAGSRFIKTLRKMLPGNISDRVVENMARDLFDPKRTHQVLAAMRRAKIKDEEILNILLSAVVGGETVARAGGG